jgi:hypothetical protein
MTLNLETLRRALPKSREEATSVRALAYLLDRPEREIRQGIKDLREKYNAAVITLPTKNGVWLSDDPAELDALIACQVSRARSIEESIRALRRLRDREAFKPALF